MKEVLARLREQNSEAFLEITELYVAVVEILASAQRLCAALREMAGGAAVLTASPGLVSPARLRTVADDARTASGTAEEHAAALGELKRGLDAWNLA
ncbi:MAG TPA: hypothetical protein VJN18_01580 [Polyangiaceae bacterium]|nr:hypothetical protein [Polyangiaceae bacterium]